MTDSGVGDPGFSPETFARRRAAAVEALGRGVMVVQAAPVQFRSGDTERRYRPDSELYYLTGATEPDTVAVLVGGAESRFILFVRERDPEAELWAGARLGPDGARERFGADETFPVSELQARLPLVLREGRRVHFRPGRGDALERIVLTALVEARLRGARRGSGPRGIIDPGEILDELRLVKDAEELRAVRAAAAVTIEGHRAALRAARPGMGEWELEAIVDHAFRRSRAAGPAYGTIVGSGPNACVLHYVENGARMADGTLVLLDAGAEYAHYNGDVTRTFPVGGRFSPDQRAVYEVVERARAAAVAAVRPGATIAAVHQAAVRVIAEGLVALGVLEGPVEDRMEDQAYRPYFPHQTSHWLGLDVHDPGDYLRDDASRVLEAGMVLTIEPGVYFRPGVGGRAGRFAGVGVRVEDDVAVTPEGRENLTADLPTSADAVEEMVRAARAER